MNKLQLTFILGFSLLITMPAVAADNWSVNIAEDPITQSSGCLLESKTLLIEDGQTETPVKLVYNGKQVYANTKSTIDMSYPKVGIQIDHHNPFTISRIHKDTTAVFSAQANEIHQRFIDGRTAKLSLGFWPTWPKTQTRVIKFSLIGYTKAFEQFKTCQDTGKLP